MEEYQDKGNQHPKVDLKAQQRGIQIKKFDH